MSPTLSRRHMLGLSLAGLAPQFLGIGGCARPDVAVEERVSVRDLTVGLWAGAPDIATEPWQSIETTNGRNNNRTISGPFVWNDRELGRTLTVYERMKVGEGYTKRQLLTVTHDGQGLGRVLDQRTGAPLRRFLQDIIFPLGMWSRGEQRHFESIEHTIMGPAKRSITLTIKRLDFTFRGRAHSLEYDRTARDAANRIRHYERYVYSPGEGLVAFVNLMKK